jgi:glycosyltransferase involved in cell wall biosynthesis
MYKAYQSMLKIAFIANEPPPYRIPVFNRIAAHPGISLQVFFCCRREPNRFWDLPPMHFDHVYLSEKISTVNGRYIHNNPDVFGELKDFGPDVIVTNGFNPTHLYAFAYARMKGIPFVPSTDGTVESEKKLSAVHRLVRRILYARANAYLYASSGGKNLYQSYQIHPQHCFQFHLCTDNAAFNALYGKTEKKYDLIFCGRVEPVKNPLFALSIAAKTAERLNRKVSIIFVGDGSQLETVKAASQFCSHLVDAHFHGFASQAELPALYQSARVFLFPTLWDPWGVVANEACAAGLPVVVTRMAGVSGELIRHQENGFICELNEETWVQNTVDLLTHPELWARFSRRSLAMADQYNFDAAAQGLIDACFHAVRRKPIYAEQRPAVKTFHE